LSLGELTATQKKDLNLKSGVRVEAAEGAAARAGLREGDVIVAVANTEVGSVKELEGVVARMDKSRPINVLFRRGEWAQYAVIRPQR
jgi:serine protease Do